MPHLLNICKDTKKIRKLQTNFLIDSIEAVLINITDFAELAGDTSRLL